MSDIWAVYRGKVMKMAKKLAQLAHCLSDVAYRTF